MIITAYYDVGDNLLCHLSSSQVPPNGSSVSLHVDSKEIHYKVAWIEWNIDVESKQLSANVFLKPNP